MLRGPENRDSTCSVGSNSLPGLTVYHRQLTARDTVRDVKPHRVDIRRRGRCTLDRWWPPRCRVGGRRHGVAHRLFSAPALAPATTCPTCPGCPVSPRHCRPPRTVVTKLRAAVQIAVSIEEKPELAHCMSLDCHENRSIRLDLISDSIYITTRPGHLGTGMPQLARLRAPAHAVPPPRGTRVQQQAGPTRPQRQPHGSGIHARLAPSCRAAPGLLAPQGGSGGRNRCAPASAPGRVDR